MTDTEAHPSTTATVTSAKRTASHVGAWVVAFVAGLVAVALIVFLVSNDQRVKVSFFGVDGHSSLAVALLVAAVGGALITLLLWGALSLHRRRGRR